MLSSKAESDSFFGRSELFVTLFFCCAQAEAKIETDKMASESFVIQFEYCNYSLRENPTFSHYKLGL
jgi:hypothetical protein